MLNFMMGGPVTASDVVFSLEKLRSDEALTLYGIYWADIKEAKAISKDVVKFTFSKLNNELPLITLQLPVLPQHIYGDKNFGRAFNKQIVGSGPYQLKKYQRGSSVTYERVKDWWGSDLPVFKGRYNFDKIHVKYYKDETAQVESFKKGAFDFYHVYNSKVWANDLDGQRFARNYIVKDHWKHANNAGSQGFLFNLRDQRFQDIRVRQAMALAFDFSWSNKNLFYGQYTEGKSYFENSELAARGRPTNDELAILSSYKNKLRPEVFDKPMGYLGEGKTIKQRLRMAKKLLTEAGYKVAGGVAKGPGGHLDFKVLTRSPAFNRVIEALCSKLATTRN